MKERKVISTGDNSKTLLIPEMEETYHSTHGALTESKHIYINAGLKPFIESHQKNNALHIFEMGFGTGLNAILTYESTIEDQLDVFYTTIEKYPISLNELDDLAYDSEFSNQKKAIFQQMHQISDDKLYSLSPHFHFKKLIADIHLTPLKNHQFDLIYYDAFAPKHQADLWTLDILQKMYDVLKTNGVLITYCAQGQFKRNLKSIGFEVVSLDGPPGKREITKAIKI